MTGIRYPYSKIWLIFWVFVYLPIGLVLLSHMEYVSETEVTRWKYKRNRGWVYFWALVFFPVAFLLLALNGEMVKTPIHR